MRIFLKEASQIQTFCSSIEQNCMRQLVLWEWLRFIEPESFGYSFFFSLENIFGMWTILELSPRKQWQSSIIQWPPFIPTPVFAVDNVSKIHYCLDRTLQRPAKSMDSVQGSVLAEANYWPFLLVCVRETPAPYVCARARTRAHVDRYRPARSGNLGPWRIQSWTHPALIFAGCLFVNSTAQTREGISPLALHRTGNVTLRVKLLSWRGKKNYYDHFCFWKCLPQKVREGCPLQNDVTNCLLRDIWVIGFFTAFSISPPPFPPFNLSTKTITGFSRMLAFSLQLLLTPPLLTPYPWCLVVPWYLALCACCSKKQSEWLGVRQMPDSRAHIAMAEAWTLVM